MVASTVGEFLLQNCAVLCNAAGIRFPETPSVCNGAQACENALNSLGLNYKSAALPTLATGYRITELCAWSEATLYFSRLELSAFSVLLPRPTSVARDRMAQMLRIKKVIEGSILGNERPPGAEK